MQCMQGCIHCACQAQHSTAQAMQRADFCLTHKLFTHTCLPARLQHIVTSRAGGCNCYRLSGLRLCVLCFEGLAGAAESMDNPRYLTALQHEGCHCRRLSAIVQCKGSGICLPLCICHMMHADSRVCMCCAVRQNAHGSDGCWRLSQVCIMSKGLKDICWRRQFWHCVTYNQAL